MRMGKQYKVNVRGMYRQLTVFINIRTLFHTAVDEDLSAAGLQQCAGAGYFVGGAKECQFHERSLPLSFDFLRWS